MDVIVSQLQPWKTADNRIMIVMRSVQLPMEIITHKFAEAHISVGALTKENARTYVFPLQLLV
jgi:hypothetical protein